MNKKYYIYTIISCCIFMGCSMGLVSNCMGLFLSPLSKSLNIGLGSSAMIVTIMNLSSAFFGLIYIKLFKRFKIGTLIRLSIILVMIILLIFSVNSNIYLFYFLAIFLGIGYCGYCLVPITIIITNWFNYKHGIIMGLCISFSGVFGAVFNPIFNIFIMNFGWRLSFVFMSIIIGLLAIPFTFLIHYQPEEVNLKIYGAKDEFDDKKDSNHNFVFLLLLFSIILSIIVGFNTHLASFAYSLKLNSTIGALMVSASMISNIISKVLIGYLSDKYQAINANIIILLFPFGSYLLFLNINNNYILAILGAFLFGFIFAIFGTGIPLIVKQIYSTKNYSKIYPLCSLCTNLSYAIGVAIIGFGYDYFNSFIVLIYFALFLSIILIGILFYFKYQID